MMYVLTNCTLPENLLTGASHKRFQTLITKATAAGVSWHYTFGTRTLELRDAPSGLEEKLAAFGKVEVRADASVSSM